MEYVIFLNGVYPNDIEKIKKIVEGKKIVCADGGTNFCYKLNLMPELIIGDLDSIDEDVLSYYTKQNIKIVRTIKEKDYTDFELALMSISNEKILDVRTRFKNTDKILPKKRDNKILVIGATGKRVDMSLSNILKLQNNKNMIFITEEFEYMRYICLKDEVEIIENLKEKTFSIIPITTLKNLDLKGFVYNLDKTTIDKSVGLASNIVKDDKAYIYCQEGEMYLIYE